MNATQHQIQAAFGALRKSLDDSGYGMWVSDAKLMPVAVATANAVAAVAPAPTGHPTPSPAPVNPPTS